MKKQREEWKPVPEQYCIDCYHYELCNNAGMCCGFQDIDKIIELPCKVGEDVYKISRNYIYGGGTITKVPFKVSMYDDINITIFLNEEDAIKALRNINSEE